MLHGVRHFWHFEEVEPPAQAESHGGNAGELDTLRWQVRWLMAVVAELLCARAPEGPPSRPLPSRYGHWQSPCGRLACRLRRLRWRHPDARHLQGEAGGWSKGGLPQIGNRFQALAEREEAASDPEEFEGTQGESTGNAQV